MAATSARGWPPALAPGPCQGPPQGLPRACPCAARPPAASATWAAALHPQQRRAAETLLTGYDQGVRPRLPWRAPTLRDPAVR